MIRYNFAVSCVGTSYFGKYLCFTVAITSLAVFEVEFNISNICSVTAKFVIKDMKWLLRA